MTNRAAEAVDTARVARTAATPARTISTAGGLLNTELGELAFQERVLALAADPATPLLERVGFLAIVGSNLDEFYMTRVAGFQHQHASGSVKRTMDGLSAAEQLHLISAHARRVIGRAYAIWRDALLPELAEHGVEVVGREVLDDETLVRLARPLSLSPARLPPDGTPELRRAGNHQPLLLAEARDAASGEPVLLFAALPARAPGLVRVGDTRRFVRLEVVAGAALEAALPELRLGGVWLARLTRSARLGVELASANEMAAAVEEAARRRHEQPVVRAELQHGAPGAVRGALLRGLTAAQPPEGAALTEADVFDVHGPLALTSLRAVAALDEPALRYPPLLRRDPFPAGTPLWPLLREADRLVRYPDEAFDATLERLLDEAADDDAVASVMLTLYRAGDGAGILTRLQRARAAGARVLAVVEPRASFHEQQNLRLAQRLRDAGVEVRFGPSRYKVHAKLVQVVRREDGGERAYTWIGTGNFNPASAASYTDLALLTADPTLGAEVRALFEWMAGAEEPAGVEALLAAPVNLRERFHALVEREIRHARDGAGGLIRAKMNGLADRDMVALLQRASGAGVRIDLVVRGICALRPGVPGLTEHVRVASRLGRFLEHTRIFHFENAGEPEYYIGSSDWRGRNLGRRVEVVAPVRDPQHRAALDAQLTAELADPAAWELRADGTYVRPPPGGGGAP